VVRPLVRFVLLGKVRLWQVRFAQIVLLADSLNRKVLLVPFAKKGDLVIKMCRRLVLFVQQENLRVRGHLFVIFAHQEKLQ
jgi:hypothetical protein